MVDMERPSMRETWPLRTRQWLFVLATYLTLVGVWSAVGKGLTGPWKDSAVVRQDGRVARWFVAQRTPTRTDLSWVGSQMSETLLKIVVTALLGLLMLGLFKRWLEPLVIALPLAVEAAVFLTVTVLVKRPRPDVPRLDGSPVATSFPSGHVAAACVYGSVAVIVFWHTRNRLARAGAVIVTGSIPICVGLARMYRGMHSLTDVIAGGLLGITSTVVITTMLARTPQGRQALAETRAARDARGARPEAGCEDGCEAAVPAPVTAEA
jgi:undecaprenyl-diphosphatase